MTIEIFSFQLQQPIGKHAVGAAQELPPQASFHADCSRFGKPRVRLGAPVKTGERQWVKVPYDEGVAIHIGPESWVCVRKDVDQALTGGMRAGY